MKNFYLCPQYGPKFSCRKVSRRKTRHIWWQAEKITKLVAEEGVEEGEENNLKQSGNNRLIIIKRAPKTPITSIT